MFLGSSEIPRFEHALDPDEDEKPKCLKPTILPEIVNSAKENVRNIVANQMKGDNKGKWFYYRTRMII